MALQILLDCTSYDFNQASTLPLKPETDGQYAANAEDTAAIEGNSREIRQRQGKNESGDHASLQRK